MLHSLSTQKVCQRREAPRMVGSDPGDRQRNEVTGQYDSVATVCQKKRGTRALNDKNIPSLALKSV